MSVTIKTRDELIGKPVPSVVFHTRQDDAWQDVSTDDLFEGKKVAVFSLPGAFTPTCSSTHLPRYNELAQEFYARGFDSIVCISVNDAFVMNAWVADQEAENIVVVPDGNGEFTRGMGMLVNKAELGFGDRSWRYSMIVNDGKIEEIFIEPVKDGDPFEVSDADTMLQHLDPEWQPQESITVFTKPGCPFCARAKALLRGKDLRYEEIVLGRDASITSLRAITGKASTPQIFIGGKYIGGSEELLTYLA